MTFAWSDDVKYFWKAQSEQQTIKDYNLKDGTLRKSLF